jgi:hypothetical protein
MPFLFHKTSFPKLKHGESMTANFEFQPWSNERNDEGVLLLKRWE